MSKISAVVAELGLPVEPFAQFIAGRKDEITTRWGFFDTYGRNTILRLGLFEDIIVVVGEDSQYEMGYKVASGIGHNDYLYAVSTDLTRWWDCSECLSYRDQWKPEKDRMGPLPEKFIGLSKSADGKALEVTALMPDGRERKFALIEREKK